MVLHHTNMTCKRYIKRRWRRLKNKLLLVHDTTLCYIKN